MAGELNDLYVWVVDDTDGREGVIAVYIPAIGPGLMSLHTRDEKIAKGPFRELAIGHGKAAKRPVRLLKMSDRTVIDDIPIP